MPRESSGRPRASGRTYIDEEWDRAKNQFHYYYIEKNMSLKDAARCMSDNHGFDANLRQWERRIAPEKWGFSKYVSRDNRFKAIDVSTSIIAAVPAPLSFSLKRVQTGLELQQEPENAAATTLETIASIKTEITNARAKRVAMSKECSSDDLAEYDRSVRETEAALTELETLVEPLSPARMGPQHSREKTRAMWLARDSKSLSTASHRLSLAHQRMLSVIMDIRMRRDHNPRGSPPASYEGPSPPQYHTYWGFPPRSDLGDPARRVDRDDPQRNGRNYTKSLSPQPPRRRERSISYSRSPSRTPPRRRGARARSLPRRRRRSPSYSSYSSCSRSRSPSRSLGPRFTSPESFYNNFSVHRSTTVPWEQNRSTYPARLAEPNSSLSLISPTKDAVHLTEKSKAQNVNVLDRSDALEVLATYIDNDSIGTKRRKAFIYRFAAMLRDDVSQQRTDSLSEMAFSGGIDELLADFAIRIVQNDSSPDLRKAMVLIHKHRSLICRTLLEMTRGVHDENSKEEQSIPEKPPLEEIMQMWHEREQYVNKETQTSEGVTDIESPLEAPSDSFEDDSQSYERLIGLSPAYKWLIARLQNNLLLSNTNGEVINQIHERIRKYLAEPVHLSEQTPPTLTKAIFELEWSSEFLDRVTNGEYLDSILTVTGSEQEAQAMTCAQYIEQTWPINGTHLWQLTKDAVLHPGVVASSRSIDNTSMSAQLCGSMLEVSMIGVRGVLIEAAEQLCWMRGALNSTPSTFDDGMILCIPSLECIAPIRTDRSYSYSPYDGSGHDYQADAGFFPFRRVSQPRPRDPLPQDPAGDVHPGRDQTFSTTSESKSRNVVGSCTNCRRKRIRCDGDRPSCHDCQRARLTCEWAADVDTALAEHLSQLILTQPTTYESHEAHQIVRFKVNVVYKRSEAIPRVGTCWQSLFKKSVTVLGFPIRRRPRSELGLELSLELMAELMGTKRLHQFDERMFFKQFFMMLTPSSQEDDCLIWHLCRSRDGDRISYLDHGMHDVCKCDYEDLLNVRHIIGWCSNIKHLAGHVAGHYSVESSLLEMSPPSGSLFNCHLSFGRPVSGGNNVYFSSNHQRASLSQRNYLDMFRFMERRSVVFWDTGTNRGWLINGLRALLHILRQSFKIDENEDLGGMFILKPEDLVEPKQPFGPRAAREFLSTPSNMSAKISISSIRGTECVYETLGERFERIYDVVEQAFDYQSKRRDWNRIPRSYLEGWDFLSLANRDDTIPSSMTLLPPIGKIWVDFVRATGAITLLGDGFGDLLQPENSMCNAVPCDRFCLAVSISDLRDVLRLNRCKVGVRPSIICRSPSIIWHSPRGSSRHCACIFTEESRGEHQPRVQVMWPAAQKGLLPAEEEEFTLEGRANGAVVFGHDDSLQYHIPDFGQIPQFGPPPQDSKELELVDSGIGSSLDSASGLGKVLTRSTLSPFDDSLSMQDISDNQCHSYGNSSMSGGYGIYGNVTGNLSVNQYFGLMPNQDTNHNSIPPTPSLPQKASSVPSQVEGGDTPISLHRRETVPLSPEQEEQDGMDWEIQQGETEIEALGLQNYCHVFRY